MTEASNNEISRNELRKAVDGILGEGYVLWEGSQNPPLSANDRYYAVDAAGAVYEGPFKHEFAAACQSFYLFRGLHQKTGNRAENTLLGDYFFSQFSRNLIPLDSVPLIDAFSEYLAKNACNEGEDYLVFIGKLPSVIRS